MRKLLLLGIMILIVSSIVYADNTIIYTTDDSYDATIKFKNGVYERTLEDSLDVGIKDGNAEWYKAYLQFDLSTIPANAIINSATLTVYYNDVKTDPSCVSFINIKNITDWYPIDETDWTLDGPTIDSFLTDEVVRNTYYDYDVTSYSSSSILNIMFEVSNYPVTGSGECKLLLADTGAERPKITINYDVPIVYLEDTDIINIEQLYFSPQVLQGGYTEIFAIIRTNGTTPDTTLTLTYPDNNSREITMHPTVNEDEYRAFITDTFQVGTTKFLIKSTVDNYLIEYGNQYTVAAYNLDFVETVNSVALCQEVETVKNVDEPEMNLFGTEYEVGELATVFLQLRDGQGLPENEGDCHLDIYYPSIANQSHPIFIEDAPMMYKEDSKGLYFYDFYVPNISGVYMMSASCSYAFSGGFVYSPLPSETESPNRTSVIGTHYGTTIAVNAYNDFVYTKCYSAVVSKECEAYYDFDTKVHYDNLTNITDLNLYYMGESDQPANLIFYVWNWTSSSWITLSNSLTYSGAATASSPTGVNDFVTNSLPLEVISPTGIIRIRLYASHTKVFYQYNNMLSIKILSSDGELYDLKGGGEIHASESLTEYFLELDGKLDSMPANVWNYTNRNLTYYQDFTNYLAAAEYVWNRSNRNLTYYQDFRDYSELALYVWNTTNRNLTYYQDIVDYALVSEFVWNRTDRNLTYYEDIVNYLLVQELVWNRSNRNLTYYPATTDETDYPLIQSYVWNATTRDLTYYENFNDFITASEYVWNNTNRNLTYYPSASVDYDAIQEYVWNSTNRNLTYYQNFNDYVAVAEYVWNRTDRNLTFYPATTDETDYLAIQEYVWNRTNRNLTYYQINDYLLQAEYVWNLTQRNLTYYPPTTDETDYLAIQEYVWN